MTNETITPHQATIEPPEGAGWQVHSPYGSQRFKEGPHGLVVRLADVVRWLMQAREMAFADAVRAVCAPLESDSPPLVYRLDPIEKPAPEDQPSEWFKLLPGWSELGLESLPPSTAWARAASADIRASWLMTPRALEWLVNAPGYPTEYDGAKETPFEFSERADRTGGPKTLAVTFAAAHALWGWGTVSAVGSVAAAEPATVVPPDPLAPLDPELRKTFEDVCKRRASSKGQKNGAREPWPDDDVATVCKVLNALGRTGAKTIAPLLFMSDSAVRKLAKREPQKPAAPTANNPFPTARPKAA